MNNIIDFEKRLLDAAKMIQEHCASHGCNSCPFYNGGGNCAFETTPNLWKIRKVKK